MSLAPSPATVAAPERHRARLLDLIAMVVVAGIALAFARGVREACRGPRGEETVLTPTLLALGFWAAIPLAEGIAARLRARPAAGSNRVRGIAWRALFLAAIATCLIAQVRLLGRHQVKNEEVYARTSEELAGKWGKDSLLYKNWYDDIKRHGGGWGHFHELLALKGSTILVVAGILLAATSRRSSRRAGRVTSPRPPIAGWLYLGLLIAAPIAAGLAAARVRSEWWAEGLGSDRHWTWRARTLPIVALGVLAWLGAAEWLARDLRSASRPRSWRSIAYRVLMLGAAASAAIVLAPLLPSMFPGPGARSWDQPIDGPRAFWFGLTAAALAAGIAARANAPAEARPLPSLLRFAKGAAVAVVALAALVLVVAAWEEEMETIRGLLPSVWNSHWFGEVRYLLDVYVNRAFRAVLWAASLAYLAIGVVRLIGPRRTSAATGAPARLLDIASGAWTALGSVVVVAAIVAPYLVEALRFDDQLRDGLSLVRDLIERLDAAAGAVLEAIDVELVFLAPGAFWLASRFLDGFAPPADSPLDVALASGPTSRWFAADWLSLIVLLASAPPIAFAGMLIVLD